MRDAAPQKKRRSPRQTDSGNKKEPHYPNQRTQNKKDRAAITSGVRSCSALKLAWDFSESSYEKSQVIENKSNIFFNLLNWNVFGGDTFSGSSASYCNKKPYPCYVRTPENY